MFDESKVGMIHEIKRKDGSGCYAFPAAYTTQKDVLEIFNLMISKGKIDPTEWEIKIIEVSEKYEGLKLFECIDCGSIFCQKPDKGGAICIACGRLEVDGFVKECDTLEVIEIIPESTCEGCCNWTVTSCLRFPSMVNPRYECRHKNKPVK